MFLRSLFAYPDITQIEASGSHVAVNFCAILGSRRVRAPCRSERLRAVSGLVVDIERVGLPGRKRERVQVACDGEA